MGSTKHATNLVGATETLIPTLIGRAIDSQSPNSILNDKYAQPALSQLSSEFIIDISKFKVTEGHAAVSALRGRSIDKLTLEFIKANQEAKTDITVVHIACALDSRALRVQDSIGDTEVETIHVRWFDIDLPEPVAVRQKLADSMTAPKEPWDYSLVAESATNEGWLERVPADRPTLVIFEGLSMYLKKEDGELMIKRLVDRFPEGQLIFDIAGSYTFKMSQTGDPLKATGAEFSWYEDDPKTIERLDPQLKLRDSLEYADMDGFCYVPEETMEVFTSSRGDPERNIGSVLRFDF